MPPKIFFYLLARLVRDKMFSVIKDQNSLILVFRLSSATIILQKLKLSTFNFFICLSGR